MDYEDPLGLGSAAKKGICQNCNKKKRSLDQIKINYGLVMQVKVGRYKYQIPKHTSL